MDTLETCLVSLGLTRNQAQHFGVRSHFYEVPLACESLQLSTHFCLEIGFRCADSLLHGNAARTPFIHWSEYGAVHSQGKGTYWPVRQPCSGED